MIEIEGDFWRTETDLRCITTNGAIRANGNAIMGAGIALQARDRYPDVEHRLGLLIQSYGNHVHYIEHNLVSFPTKFHWKSKGDLNLIKRSASELVELLSHSTFKHCKRILLTRPGCGNGGLDWAQVKPAIAPLLDSRFIIVTPPSEGRSASILNKIAGGELSKY